MIETKAISGAVHVRVTKRAGPLPPSIEARVATLWEEAVHARGDALFNGSIVSVVATEHDFIEAEIVEYRRLVALRADPDLRTQLAVRPLAVSGLLRCADGIVFGRRSRHVTDAGGQWELAPSGGVDGAGLMPGDVFEPKAPVLAELVEELGVRGSSVEQATPFCLVDDHPGGVVDIGIELHAPGLGTRDLVDCHRREGTDEYDEISVVAEVDLAPFVAEHTGLVPVSVALLGARGLL